MSKSKVFLASQHLCSHCDCSWPTHTPGRKDRDFCLSGLAGNGNVVIFVVFDEYDVVFDEHNFISQSIELPLTAYLVNFGEMV